MLNDIYQSLDPIAFEIGPLAVRWYGLGYVFGFLFAGIYIVRLARRWKINFGVDAVQTMLIACMLGAILGGRLGYVLFYGKGYYFEHPEEIFTRNISGMSYHGGMLGLAIGLMLVAKTMRVPLLTLGDLASCATPIGLGLVRIANFINGELWGSVTEMPWGVVFAGAGPLPRHPTQLYEAFLEGLVLFLILYLLARRSSPLPRGSYFSVYLIGYGVFRIAIEFIRQPDVQMGYLLGTSWLTMGMILSLPMVLFGACLLVVSLKRSAPQEGLAWLPEPDDATGEEPSDELGDAASDELGSEEDAAAGDASGGELGDTEDDTEPSEPSD